MTGDDAREGRGTDTRKATEGDLSARLKDLDAQLDRKRASAPRRETRSDGSVSGPSSLGRAFRMSTEFVAGVIAGGGLGWFVDRMLGTSPWGLIVLLMLGFCAGIYNVMRVSGFMGPSQGSGSALGSKPKDR
jgi:ATP synthase protein I